MEPPTTPKRRATQELTNIVNSLSVKWGLQFPTRDESWSPIKIQGRRSIGDDVVDRIKYLHFRKPEALSYALMHFEEQATSKCSKWVSKPHAEQDVIPRRTRSSSSNDFIGQSKIDKHTAAELMEILLDLVDQISEVAKRKGDYRIYDRDTISEFPLPPPEPKLSPMRQSKLSRYWAHESSSKAFHDGQVHSSDEFNPDPDLSTILNDINMVDEPVDPFSTTRESEDDDEYQTPPTTPPALASIEGSQKNGDTFVQRPELFHMPNMGAARKRPLEEPAKPLTRRKFFREGQASEALTSYNPNHLGPLTSPAEVTICQNIPPRVAGDTKQVPHLDSYDSFASTISNASKAGSSSAWRSMPPSTTRTTPNTSFRTDSLATSFDSVDSAALGTSFCDESKSALSEPTLIAEPNTPRTEKLNLALQGLSTTAGSGSNIGSNPIYINLNNTHNSLRSPNPTSATKVEKICHIEVKQYLQTYLTLPSLLPSFANSAAPRIPFRQLYEVTRVSSYCKLTIDEFVGCLNETTEDYEDLWSRLASIVTANDAALPERSSQIAWRKATDDYQGVSLSCSLKFSPKAKTPVFECNLNPLRREHSYRLSREFGGDRFLTIDMPPISHESLPQYLKPNQSTAATIREGIVDWLVDVGVNMLGKIWRAFFVKKVELKKEGRREILFRVYLFAGNEAEFAHFLNWFLPFKTNQDQRCLKFFSRLNLGVSPTTPTIQFEPFEIIRTGDARADVPSVRRLFPLETADKERQKKSLESKAEIMNDGCARISKAAAIAIAEMLGLDQIPCVFQGRIAGAKGVWMVDSLDESLPQSKRDWWIEITDSQAKFQPHLIDSYNPPRRRVTFDVHSYPKKLSPAKISLQLLPILAHQGVPRQTFEHLLEEDLKSKVDVLKEAVGSGLTLRKWNQKINSVRGERAPFDGIETQRGLPRMTAEKINWFVEHGFHPRSCRYLNHLVYNTIKDYSAKLKDGMKMELAKSTFAFMISDPLALLEEGEVHLGFSSTFKDPKDRWEDTMLHGIEVLVARLPAVLPSDIQKVRAVYKPELRRYKDVIVFSSKGACSLASKLSGGDYDGDQAWICWENSIVGPFQNSDIPPDKPSDDSFGITEDKLKVSELIQDPDHISKFLKHGLNFNMQSNMLGICSMYHEALCYSGTSIDDPRMIDVACLLGRLVDGAKAGLIFDEKNWAAYKRSANLPLMIQQKPAYKDKGNQRPNFENIVDSLVFKTAERVCKQALKDFSEQCAVDGTSDEDLVQIWKREFQLSKTDPQLATVLKDLIKSFDDIAKFWSLHMPHDPPDTMSTSRKSSHSMPFSIGVETCRQLFLALKPSLPSPNSPSSILHRWHLEASYPNHPSSWSTLKASGFYHQFHHRDSMVWHVAGTELGEIKAKARGLGGYRVVDERIHRAMKVGKIKGAETEKGKGTEGAEKEWVEAEDRELDFQEGEESDDEFGSWSWELELG